MNRISRFRVVAEKVSLAGLIVIMSGISGCNGPEAPDSTQQTSFDPSKSSIVLIDAKADKKDGETVELENQLENQNKMNEELRNRVNQLEAELKDKEALYNEKLDEVSRAKDKVKATLNP